MSIKTNKKELLAALHLCKLVAPMNNLFPALQNVRLGKTGNGELQVAATDLDVSVIVAIEASTANITHATAVNCRQLLDVVKSFAGETIGMSISGGDLTIECEDSYAELPTTPMDEYPDLNHMKQDKPVSVETSEFYRGLEQTAFAVSLDETRYNLNGVCLESVAGKTRFVSSDGHRLAMVDINLPGFAPTGVLVPRLGLKVMQAAMKKRLDGSTQIDVVDGHLITRTGNVLVSTRLIDGEFPDYRQAVPTVRNTRIVVERRALINVAERACKLLDSKVRAVMLDINGKLTITGQSPTSGKLSETLDIEHEGDDVRIGISAKYLAEALKKLKNSDKVTLGFDGELAPITVNGDCYCDTQHVIMPMRDM